MNRVFFYCQSSLGIGHTIRSQRIAEGLSEQFEVHLIHGGEPIPGLQAPPAVHTIHLPAIKSDAEFTTLTPAEPGLSLERALERRRDIMLSTFRRLAPEMVLVELFPFGRRQFGPELKPLLAHARENGARIVCSLRDIVVRRRDQAAFEQKVVELMNRYFDLLLVHSDPDFQSLDESFARLDALRADVVYTGYVVPPISRLGGGRSRTIIASIGGGRFGHELAEAVVRAAPRLAEIVPHTIELYTGPFCPDEVATRLREQAEGQGNLRVERFTPDLHRRLARAELSISMGGYNTTMNVLATGIRAMMMACRNNGGMDQVERVEKLGRLRVVDVIRPDDLAPEVFARRVAACLQREPDRATIDLDGVPTTARVLAEFISAPGCRDVPRARETG